MRTEEQVLIAMFEALIPWYEAHKRELPWRQDKEPYHVWLSEIMLQQTRVEAVKEYYRRFLTALPTIADLAEAPEEQILKLWEGLGYYNRVRNLQKAAQTICAEYTGVFPSEYAQIRSLSGIGDYTAGAIASICFDAPTPAVDGNVLRVYSRLLAHHEKIAGDVSAEESGNRDAGTDGAWCDCLCAKWCTAVRCMSGSGDLSGTKAGHMEKSARPQ